MVEPPDDPPLTRCPRCGGLREASHFVSAAGKPLLTCQKCRDRSKRELRERREQLGSDGVRAANLRTKYGITAAQYDSLREAQNFRCAICGRHEDELPATAAGRPRLDGRPTAPAFKLVVDHCHQSGRVRGLLCVGCNAALGNFRDDPAVLKAALNYLSVAASKVK
jgi:transposase-like protein